MKIRPAIVLTLLINLLFGESLIAAPGSCPTVTITTTPSACRLSTGTASVHLSGGTGTYSYTWSSGPDTLATDSNLASNSYTVTVSGSGCIVTASVDISDSGGPTAAIIATVYPFCGNDSDGRIVASAIGGAMSYTWSSGQTGATILQGIPAGTYTLTVEDTNGCKGVASATLLAPAPITVSNYSIPVSCNGGSDGSITVTISGGTPPYTNAWSNDSSASYNGFIPAGIYTDTIIDRNHCVYIDSGIVVSQPPVLHDTILRTGASLMALASGGSPPYFYVWSNDSSGNKIANVTAGSYSVTAIDQFNCGAIASIIVASVESISAGVNKFNAYPNPSEGIYIIAIEMTGAADVDISVNDLMGRTVYESEEKNIKNLTQPLDMEGMSKGTYIITLRTASGSLNQRIVLE